MSRTIAHPIDKNVKAVRSVAKKAAEVA
jgi:hypothetical protein